MHDSLHLIKPKLTNSLQIVDSHNECVLMSESALLAFSTSHEDSR